ncbi:Multifunctional methyltransferase subunit TRM112-like protein [Aphelenchoides fujianensis]|nr:Multifunctional methyltransferase subunit TRM112-like protein [Aphelenchoides fujianensis]
MRLLTHNFLSSQFLKNVQEGYPLVLRATKVEQKEFQFNEQMMANLLKKINYPVLLDAARSVGVDVQLPSELPADSTTNSEFLRKVAEIANVEVVDGELECPESGHRFLIREGIPNMLVSEEEGSSSTQE